MSNKVFPSCHAAIESLAAIGFGSEGYAEHLYNLQENSRLRKSKNVTVQAPARKTFLTSVSVATDGGTREYAHGCASERKEVKNVFRAQGAE